MAPPGAGGVNMPDVVLMFLMPGVFIAIGLLYYVASAAGLILSSVWRLIRRRQDQLAARPR